MAKRFFYVCAGLLCLAVSYHLGARQATAQGGALGLVLGWSGAPMVATANGDVWRYSLGCGNCPPWEYRSNIFGGDPAGRTIVALVERSALASSGEVFLGQDSGYGPWVNLGVPPTGPAPAEQSSWGGIKARYRGEHEPQGVKHPTNR